MARYTRFEKYMVRKVPVSKWSMDLGHWEVIDKSTKKRECIEDVFVNKETAVRVCAQMNAEVSHDRERRAEA